MRRMTNILRIGILAMALCLLIASASAADVWDSGSCGGTGNGGVSVRPDGTIVGTQTRYPVNFEVLSDMTINIYGSGKMENYGSATSTRPWRLYGDVVRYLNVTGEVTHVGDFAFANHDSLRTITFGENVESIGQSAFQSCGTITSVTFLGDVPDISGDAFYGTTATCYYPADNDTWTEYYLDDYGGTLAWCTSDLYFASYPTECISSPGKTTTISAEAVGNGLTYQWQRRASSWSAWENFPDASSTTATLSFVGNIAYNGYQYRCVVTDANGNIACSFPGTIRCAYSSGSCGDGVNWELDKDFNLTISGSGAMEDYLRSTYNGVAEIDRPWDVFEADIKSVVVEDGITYIGKNAFADCSAAAQITLPDSVTQIGQGAFSGCGSLTEITLPNSVTQIGRAVFYECDSLTDITLPNSITEIPITTFYGCSSLEEIVIPASVTSVGEQAFSQCRNLERVIFLGGEPTFGANVFYDVKPALYDYDPLSAPTVTVANRASDGKPVISWTAVEGATGYEVYYRGTGDDDYALLWSTTDPGKLSVAHTDATVNKQYSYKVRAVKGVLGDTTGVWSDLKEPTLVEINNDSDGKPVISWTAVEGATGYEVYCSSWENGTYTLLWSIGDPNKLSVTHPLERWLSGYYYKVFAVNGGDRGLLSAAESAWCDLEQPAVTVTKRASDGKPVISWTKVEGAAGYKVYYCGTGDGTYELLWSTTDSSKLNVTHAEAVDGKEYFYKVVATHSNSECDSAMSDVQGIRCGLEKPVITVTTSASSGKPVISWKTIEGASGYQVYRADSSKGTYKLLTTIKDPAKLSVTHTGAVAGNDYFYKVVATYAGEAANSAMSAAKGVWCDLPRPTVTVKNRASDGKPTISWTAVEGATGYEVYRCGTSGGTYSKLISTTKLSVTHTGAAVGNDYFYKVKAIYGANTSCNSALTAAKGVWVDLKQPTVKVLNSISTGKPVIQWEKVDYAVKYKVYVAESSGGTYKLLYTTPDANKLSVTHTGAKAENDYFYKVVAVHKSSKCNSAMSAAKGVWVDLARPTLTVSLNAKNKPYLTWSKVEGADKYQVYVSTNGGAYKWLYTAAADDFDVTHTNVVSGSTYTYKVRAVSTVNSKSNSSYSVVKTVDIP